MRTTVAIQPAATARAVAAHGRSGEGSKAPARVFTCMARVAGTGVDLAAEAAAVTQQRVLQDRVMDTLPTRLLHLRVLL